MIDLEKTRDLVRWLRKGSNRPFAAINTWLAVITNLDIGTGDILLSRDEIAEEVGITPREVSEIMTEMEDYGAISRRREGRRVHYRLNEPYFTAPLRQAEKKDLPRPDGSQDAVMPTNDTLEMAQLISGEPAARTSPWPSKATMSRRRLTMRLVDKWEDWRDRFRGKGKKDG